MLDFASTSIEATQGGVLHLSIEAHDLKALEEHPVMVRRLFSVMISSSIYYEKGLQHNLPTAVLLS